MLLSLLEHSSTASTWQFQRNLARGDTAGWAGLGVSSRELWEKDRAGVGYTWSKDLSMKWDRM